MKLVAQVRKTVMVGFLVGGLLATSPGLYAREVDENTCSSVDEMVALKAFFTEQEYLWRRDYINAQQSEVDRYRAEAHLAKIFAKDNAIDIGMCFVPFGLIGKAASKTGGALLRIPPVRRVANKWIWWPLKKTGRAITGKTVQVTRELTKKVVGNMSSAERQAVKKEIQQLHELIIHPEMIFSSGTFNNYVQISSLSSYWRRKIIFERYGSAAFSKLMLAERRVLDKNLKGEGQEYLQMKMLDEFPLEKLRSEAGRAVNLDNPWPLRVAQLEKYIEELKTPGKTVPYQSASDEILANTLGKKVLLETLEMELANVKGLSYQRTMGKTIGSTSDDVYRNYLQQSYANYRHKLAKFLNTQRKQKGSLTREVADRQALRKEFIKDGDEYTKINKVFRYQQTVNMLNEEVVRLLKENTPQSLTAVKKITEEVLPLIERARDNQMLSLGGIGLVMRDRLKSGKSIIVDNFKESKGRLAKKVAGQTSYHLNKLAPLFAAVGLVGFDAWSMQHYWYNNLICTTTPEKIKKIKKDMEIARKKQAEEQAAQGIPVNDEVDPAPAPAPAADEEPFALYKVEPADAWDDDDEPFVAEPVTATDLRDAYGEAIGELNNKFFEDSIQTQQGFWEGQYSAIFLGGYNQQFQELKQNYILDKAKLAHAFNDLLDLMPLCDESDRQKILDLQAKYVGEVAPEVNDDQRAGQKGRPVDASQGAANAPAIEIKVNNTNRE